MIVVLIVYDGSSSGYISGACSSSFPLLGAAQGVVCHTVLLSHTLSYWSWVAGRLQYYLLLTVVCVVLSYYDTTACVLSSYCNFLKSYRDMNSVLTL